MASLITGQGTNAVVAAETEVKLGGGTSLLVINDGPANINIEVNDSEDATIAAYDATDFFLKPGEAEIWDLKKGHSMALFGSAAGPTQVRWKCTNAGVRSSK